jgi:hypothetical protein
MVDSCCTTNEPPGCGSRSSSASRSKVHRKTTFVRLALDMENGRQERGEQTCLLAAQAEVATEAEKGSSSVMLYQDSRPIP